MPFNVPAFPYAPQVAGSNPAYTEQQNQFVAQANSSLDAYRRAYEETMRAQGISVTWSNNQGGGASGSPVGTPDMFVATLSKDGFSVDTLISVGRAQLMPPEDLAEQDIYNALKFQARIVPGDTLPSPWYAVPEITPGPAPTVPLNTVSGGVMTTAQTAPTPNPGTIVSPPAASVPTVPSATRMTMWEWNYYYHQETGREGPDPYALGVDPARLMTKDEWAAYTATWFATIPGSPVPGSGTAPPTGGGTAPPPSNSGGTSAPPVAGGTVVTNPVDESQQRAMITLAVGFVAAYFLAKA